MIKLYLSFNSIVINVLILTSEVFVEHCAEYIDCGFVHLGYVKVIILGIFQGVTELVPISSTAHMRVIPSLFGWQDPGTAFSAAMQLAGFFAVMVYFRKEIFNISSSFLKGVFQRSYKDHGFKMGFGIILATIPVGVFGLLLKGLLNQPQSPFRSLYVIGFSSIVMGLLLIFAEKLSKHKRRFEELTIKDCILVGLAQAFALIPGVSRSGSTMTAALFLGMKRDCAAAFSFILGVPAILAAGLKELYELYVANLSLYAWKILSVGLISASIAAFLAVYGLLKYLEHRSMYLFVWYRVIMGVGIVIGAYLSWFH